jgi:tetratricopeptide (TPR) repeat protein
MVEYAHNESNPFANTGRKGWGNPLFIPGPKTRISTPATSIRLFDKAVAVQPDNAEALYMLGQELARKGDTAGAIKQWRKAIEIRPQYDEVYYSLARLLAKSDPAEAKRLQARFEEMREEQHIMDRARLLGNFALTSAAAHDWPRAVAQLNERDLQKMQCAAAASQGPWADLLPFGRL